METDVPPRSDDASAQAASKNRNLQRALLWAGVAGASAALTFFVLRATLRRTPVDETSERIQSLIDDANRLLRTLDEKKNG
jgi:hypothetical protein